MASTQRSRVYALYVEDIGNQARVFNFKLKDRSGEQKDVKCRISELNYVYDMNDNLLELEDVANASYVSRSIRNCGLTVLIVDRNTGDKVGYSNRKTAKSYNDKLYHKITV